MNVHCLLKRCSALKMKNINDIYGAKASVLLSFNGSLEELGERLSKGLHIPEFWFKTDTSPPHNMVGMCEALGSEMWIKEFTGQNGFTYLFEYETSHCLTESFDGKMHDLSSWLERYINDICNIECIKNENNLNTL